MRGGESWREMVGDKRAVEVSCIAEIYEHVLRQLLECRGVGRFVVFWSLSPVC